METKQRHPLQNHLTKPIIRPGVGNFGLARSIQRRASFPSSRHPMLKPCLQRMVTGEAAGAIGGPIVYPTPPIPGMDALQTDSFSKNGIGSTAIQGQAMQAKSSGECSTVAKQPVVTGLNTSIAQTVSHSSLQDSKLGRDVTQTIQPAVIQGKRTGSPVGNTGKAAKMEGSSQPLATGNDNRIKHKKVASEGILQNRLVSRAEMPGVVNGNAIGSVKTEQALSSSFLAGYNNLIQRHPALESAWSSNSESKPIVRQNKRDLPFNSEAIGKSETTGNQPKVVQAAVASEMPVSAVSGKNQSKQTAKTNTPSKKNSVVETQSVMQRLDPGNTVREQTLPVIQRLDPGNTVREKTLPIQKKESAKPVLAASTHSIQTFTDDPGKRSVPLPTFSEHPVGESPSSSLITKSNPLQRNANPLVRIKAGSFDNPLTGNQHGVIKGSTNPFVVSRKAADKRIHSRNPSVGAGLFESPVIQRTEHSGPTMVDLPRSFSDKTTMTDVPRSFSDTTTMTDLPWTPSEKTAKEEAEKTVVSPFCADNTVDVNEIVEKVIRKVTKQIETEQERRGVKQWL